MDDIDQKLIDRLISHFSKNFLEVNPENVKNAISELGWSQEEKDRCLNKLLYDNIKIPVGHIRTFNNLD